LNSIELNYNNKYQDQKDKILKYILIQSTKEEKRKDFQHGEEEEKEDKTGGVSNKT